MWFGNNQKSFQLHRFTMSENIVKSFKAGLLFKSHCRRLWASVKSSAAFIKAFRQTMSGGLKRTLRLKVWSVLWVSTRDKLVVEQLAAPSPRFGSRFTVLRFGPVAYKPPLQKSGSGPDLGLQSHQNDSPQIFGWLRTWFGGHSLFSMNAFACS